MAKWGSNPHSFQKTNLCNVYKGKTANLSFYIQSFKGNLKVNTKCEKKFMSHLFLERKSHIMLVHKFMNHSCLSVKFRHQELILALMIHHLHTLWHPLYGWYDSWNKSGNKKLTLTWQDVLKLRETCCINFQKHQNIKPVIVGKKFRRKNSFKQNHWHDNFFPT